MLLCCIWWLAEEDFIKKITLLKKLMISSLNEIQVAPVVEVKKFVKYEVFSFICLQLKLQIFKYKFSRYCKTKKFYQIKLTCDVIPPT